MNSHPDSGETSKKVRSFNKRLMTWRTAILLLVISSSFTLHAQKINYETSFEQAFRSAFLQRKPIAVLITIQSAEPSSGNINGLSNPEVVNKFNSYFVNFSTDRSDTAASMPLIRKYKIFRFPSFLFFDYKGGLLFSDVAFLAIPQPLLMIAEKAIRESRGKSLVDYDSIYQAGNRTRPFLKEYILKREKAGISDNACLIEDYVSGLAVSDLNSYAEVLFILKAGPYTDSTAFRLAHTNRRIIDSIYRIEPEDLRKAINNNIIRNTMQSAISRKKYSRALACANFTRDTWKNNPREAQKSWDLKMMQYHRAIKDTLIYLSRASRFYQDYVMSISTDSIKKREMASYEASRETLRFRSVQDSFAVELNNAAWDFYLLGGSRNEYLQKALFWSQRAVELSPKAAFYDTYAHLLYRLRFFDEAESMQRKAVEMAKNEKIDTNLFLEEYEKIKKRSL